MIISKIDHTLMFFFLLGGGLVRKTDFQCQDFCFMSLTVFSTGLCFLFGIK